MKRTLMIGVAAGALLAGINLATAQGTMERQAPAASGGANIEQRGGSATEQKGRASGGEMKGGAGADIKAQSPAGNARAQSQDNMKATTGQGGQQSPQGQRAQDTQKKDAVKGQNAQSKEPARSGTSAQGDTKAGSSTTAQGSGSGKEAGGAKVSLNAEQKTKIRETVIRSSNAPRVTNVNFSVSVGTVVPRTVRYAPLPPLLVEYYPTWRGYHYVIIDEQIVIIEPSSFKIVAVLAV